MTTTKPAGVYQSLQEKVVVITGGGSGIGRGTALVAAGDGARVVALDINEESLASLRQEAEGNGLTIWTYVTDVTDPESVENAVQWINAKVGIPHGLVCSAGSSLETPFLDITLSLWAKTFDLNVLGTFLIAQRIVRDMVLHGKGGSIVTLSAGQGIKGKAGSAHYAASKAAVIALTKSMALELATHQVRVNSIAPGAVDTPLMRSVVARTTGGIKEEIARIPLGRLGKPADLASMICFLLSDSSGWVTGQTILLNGGSLIV